MLSLLASVAHSVAFVVLYPAWCGDMNNEQPRPANGLAGRGSYLEFDLRLIRPKE